MAIELKDALKRVLVSAGQKRFYFAYAMGKRSDRKGNGELAVSPKKLKKPDVEGVLIDPGEYYEGFCWLSDQPECETTYFQSKGRKLSNQMITRMIQTAKHVAVRAYDFQLPSPEEEARADRLAEIDDEMPANATPGAAGMFV
jgi:hypothetical protein